MNELIPFQSLTPGAIFYIDAYHGNCYRKTTNSQAEFVRHRLGNQYVGHRMGVSPCQAVRIEALDPETMELLGIDPHAKPFLPLYEPKPSKRKRAATEEDLLGDLLAPGFNLPKRMSRAAKRAAGHYPHDLL